MLQQEIITTWEDGTKLIRTYSDAGFMIQQVETRIRYSEAIDPDFMHREYIETNEPIAPDEDPEN